MPSSAKLKLLQGSASNLLRVLLSMVVSLLLPRFMVHRMPPAEYSAWVLILQLSAYVTYLDFGVQTAIGKFVAEYDATGNRDAGRRMVSTAFSSLSIASMLGFGVVAVLTYRVPQLFRQMPSSLFHDVRIGLLCVGFSVCLMLPFSVFATTFVGLQEYGFVTVVQVGSRVLFALALVVVLLRGGTLLEMAWTMALFNVATAVAQLMGWKRYASHRVPFSFLAFDAKCLKTLAAYCGVLSIWTMGNLLISGLDTAIVGHFDYANTGYYAIAGSATNFMLLITNNLVGPLMPAVSSLQTQRTPEQLGELLLRATRLGVGTLLVFGLPLLFCGYPLLTVWLGQAYAAKSVVFLEILVVGNVLRQLGLPYAIFIVATGKQRYATVSPVAESVLNIVLSVVLARRYGAIGVALGTLIAAFVGLGCHLLISMHYTQSTITVSRFRFVAQGVLRPALAILPTLLLLPFWHRFALWPAGPVQLIAWAMATIALLWWAGLTRAERVQVRQQVQGRFGRLLYS
jgi:O-antigen/teichoic acid export membrane protein